MRNKNPGRSSMLSHVNIARRGLLAMMAAGLLMLGGIGTAVTAKADDQAVQDFVSNLSNKTLAELANQQTDADRVAKLKPILQQYFDMPAISKYVLGGYWRKATPDQQKAFVDAFT